MDADMSKGMALAEKLSDPATVTALGNLVDRITELHESGVLDSFLQTIQAITFVKDGLTDTMVSKNASMASELMEIAAEAAGPEILESVRELKEIHRTGALKDLFEITDTISFVLKSTTEKMLERNAEMIRELYSIASEAADPEMINAVREIKNLQKSGNLKVLSDAAYMVSFLANVITDSMVQRMATFGATFVEEVSAPHVTDMLKSTTKCISGTVQEFAAKPSKPGLKNLMTTMLDPEVQSGMIFMANVAKNMHKCMIETYSGK